MVFVEHPWENPLCGIYLLRHGYEWRLGRHRLVIVIRPFSLRDSPVPSMPTATEIRGDNTFPGHDADGVVYGDEWYPNLRSFEGLGGDASPWC
jgi:hypothetical protein